MNDNRTMVRNDTIETRKMAYDGIDKKCEFKDYKGYFDYARYRSFELFVRDIREAYPNGELENMACAEAGVFKGDFAWIINKNFPECQMYLYDTFEGFEEKDIEIDIDNKYMTKPYMKKIKDYFADNENTADDRMEIVRNKCPNKNTLNFRKGYFPNTIEGERNCKWVFVSLDMDLYQPTLEGIMFFYPRLVHSGGGICA